MANGTLSPSELGRLAAEHAPQTPIELIGAVLGTESTYGTNTKAYTKNGAGAIGPGQILSKQLGAKYGNFEAYYPDGDVNNPVHTTIAALRKIESDWKKSNGNLLGFSKEYFGKGTTPEGLTASNHYLPKISNTLATQGNNRLYAEFIQGASQFKANPTEFNDNRFEASRPIGTSFPGANTEPMLTLDRDEVASANLVSEADSVVQSILANQREGAAAQTEVDNIKVMQNVEKAKGAEDILTMLGLNPKVTNSEILASATVLRERTRELAQTQQEVAELRRNPLFNVFDIVSKGQSSIVQNQRIGQAQKDVATLSGTLKELQDVAQKQQAIGSNASYTLAEEEMKANARLNLAKAEDAATKLGIKAELDATRLGMQEQGLELRRMQLQSLDNSRAATLAQKVSAGKPLTAAEQRDLTAEETFEQNFKIMATRVGIDNKKFAALVGSPKYPGVEAHLADYFVSSDPEAALPLPLADLKFRLGNMDKVQREEFIAANGVSGWTSPTNPENRKYIDPADQELLADTSKLGKMKKYESAQLRTRLTNEIGIKKQQSIVNDGTPESLAENRYGANFYSIMAAESFPSLVEKHPEIPRAINSKLFTTVEEQAEAMPDKTLGVSDETVLSAGFKLFESKQLTLDEVVAQTKDYFDAAVAVNNSAIQFTEIGLPEQKSYKIPVKAKSGLRGFVGISTDIDNPNKITSTNMNMRSEAEIRLLYLGLNNQRGRAKLQRVYEGFLEITPGRVLEKTYDKAKQVIEDF